MVQNLTLWKLSYLNLSGFITPAPCFRIAGAFIPSALRRVKMHRQCVQITLIFLIFNPVKYLLLKYNNVLSGVWLLIKVGKK